jgi:glucose/arabinose dehydrogenase
LINLQKFMFGLVAGLVVTACLVACGTSTARNSVGELGGPHLERESLGESADGYSVVQEIFGLQEPWGLSFLPDGRLLITEKTGGLVLMNAQQSGLRYVRGVPPVAVVGQGGLMDVLVHTALGEEPWVYLSYSVKTDAGYTTRVARGRLRGEQLVDVDVLFTALPAYRERRHFGSRLHIDETGYLYITVGDRGNRQTAQQLDAHSGKLMRLYSDGRIPADNPFVRMPGALAEIYTYGHRNPQGLASNPSDGSLWLSEHGPRGGDEINKVVAGANYGWPIVSFGEEYGGGKIGQGTELPGITGPLFYYAPSVGTAGMQFYSGLALTKLSGKLVLAALRERSLLILDGEAFAGGADSRPQPAPRAENRLDNLNFRIRDVEQGPDGSLWLLADGDKLLRMSAGD